MQISITSQLLMVLGIFFYIYYVPISSLIVTLFFITEINLGIFSESYINFKGSFYFYIIMVYSFQIIHLNIRFRKKIAKTMFILFGFQFMILIILFYIRKFSLYNETIIQMISKFEIFTIFPLIIFFYLEVLNLKHKSIRQSFKTLNKNFYISILLISFLFIFKTYLYLNNIKIPSFYFLFLTVPISLVAIYFYTKDLAPIIKEYKNIKPNSTK